MSHASRRFAEHYRQFKHWVDRLLNDADYPPQVAFSRFIKALILVSVGMLVLEFIYYPSGVIPRRWLLIDQWILGIFAVEYMARLWVVEPALPTTVNLGKRERLYYTLAAKLSWMFKPYSLIDLAAILPLFPFLRSLRILRVLRLLTHSKVTRKLFQYFNPFAVAGQTLRANQILYLFVASFIVLAILLGTLTGYLAEHPANEKFRTPFDALWWSMVTITTVGYGDIYPITTSGRLIGMVLMMTGFFIFALMAGVVSQTLGRALLNIREEGIRMTALVNHVVVCGWNSRSMMLLHEIEEQTPDSANRVVVFAEQEAPEELPAWVTWVVGDPTQEVELSKVRMNVADSVVVVASEREGFTFSDADARTLLTVFTLRSFEAKLSASGTQRTRPIHITAELLDPDNMGFFKSAGADEVIQTALVGTTLLARAATAPQTGQLFEELVSVEGLSLQRMPVPASYALPMPFDQLAARFKQETECLVLGYERQAQRAINPPAHCEVQPGDLLVYLTAEAATLSGKRQTRTGESFWGPLSGHEGAGWSEGSGP